MISVMKHFLTIRQMTALGVALAAFGLRAETKLWYRLDTFAPGVTTTVDTVITNLANPGVMDGKCYSAKYLGKSSTTYGSDETLMPRGSVGFNGEYGVYDPVSDTWTPRYHALHFGPETCTSDQTFGDGSTVKTDVGSNLQLTTLTVEVIFRAIETFPTTWNSGPIVMLDGTGASNEAWFLGFGWSGRICTRYKCTSDTPNIQGGVKTYGGWHHAAITLDAAGTMRLYYDYALEGSRTGNSIMTFTDKALTIASNPVRDGRTFPGEIMDVRVSDVALSPEQFLHITRKPRTTPADTLVYVPYDGDAGAADSVFTSFLALGGDNLNASSHGAVSVSWYKSPSAATPQYDTVEKPALAMRMGLADTDELVPNVSALKTQVIADTVTNSTAVTLGMMDCNLEKTNFTAECFFKSSRRSSTAKESWTIFRSPGVKIGVNDNGTLLFRGFSKCGVWKDYADVVTSACADDMTWHHVAFAYCVTNGTYKAYLDGVLQATKSVVLGTENTANCKTSFGYQSDGSARQFFPGWIDEARVTLRTLGPDEFLMRDPAGTAGTLAQITFDASDATVGPYPSLTPAGTCVARTGGAVPTFSDDILPEIFLDGATMLSPKTNVKSLALAGGQVRFPRMSTLRGHNDFTVEWYMKLSAADTGTAILRLNRGTSVYEGELKAADKVWQVYVSDATHLCVRATASDGNDKDTPNFTALSGGVADNKWHHYAVTFAKVIVSGTTKTEIRLYRDRVACGMQQFTGRLGYPADDDCAFTIGANGNLTGLLDEVRVTQGVLPVNSFMRKRPGGLFILVR